MFFKERDTRLSRDRFPVHAGSVIVTSCLAAALVGLAASANIGAQEAPRADESAALPQSRRTMSTPVLSSSSSRRRTERTVSLVFTKADVRDVLAQIAGYSNADVVVTPGATGSISINIRSRTAEQAIRLVAASAGLCVVRLSGAYIVGPGQEVQKAASEFGQTAVVPLHFITPIDAVTALSRLATRVKSEATTHGIVISGLSSDLSDARAALRRLDVEPAPPPPVRPATEIVNVKAVDPAEAESVLRQAYPAITVTRQERTIILLGPPDDVTAAMKAVLTLDVSAPPVPEPHEVLVYRLKYLQARTAQQAILSAVNGRAQTPDAGSTQNDTSVDNGGSSSGGLTVTLAPEAVAPPKAMLDLLSSTAAFNSNGGSSSSSSSSSSGGAGGGAQPQVLSRPVRLIIIGPHDKVELARSLLDQTDVPQPLVRIEAAIYEVNSDYASSLGLTWDLSNTAFNFNQPAGAGGVITGQASASVRLNALVTQNRARMLANPNVSVVDNEDATIFIGQELRFTGGSTISSNGTVFAGTTETLPVGVLLLLRPRIHPDRAVTLKVHPVISTVISTVNGLPQTNSREADTTVRLREGEEMVIGGLDQTEVNRITTKLPILGDLPVIGELFRSRSYEKKKTTVVVVLRAYPVLSEPAPERDFRKGIVK